MAKKPNMNVTKMMDNEERECCIDWIDGQRTISVTLAKTSKYYRQLKKLIDAGNEDVKVVSENDNSIFIHLPAKWLKLSAPKKRNLTDEQRKAMSERLKKAREKKQGE